MLQHPTFVKLWYRCVVLSRRKPRPHWETTTLLRYIVSTVVIVLLNNVDIDASIMHAIFDVSPNELQGVAIPVLSV